MHNPIINNNQAHITHNGAVESNSGLAQSALYVRKEHSANLHGVVGNKPSWRTRSNNKPLIVTGRSKD